MSGFFKSKVGKITIISVPVIIIGIVVAVLLLKSGSSDSYRTIRITTIEGSATAENNGKSYDAYVDMLLSGGYSLLTKNTSYVRLKLDDDKYIKLEENSKASFTDFDKNGSNSTIITLDYGVITNEIANPLSEEEEFIINTPNAVLGVRGTFFRVEVVKGSQGETLTNVYTYGGTVSSQRVLPSGEVVKESIVIDGGYKVVISMDGADTEYITQGAESGKEYVVAFTLAEVPESDLVDMYVASVNGHAMFVSTEDIWENIVERDIDLEKYRSNRNGEKIPPYTSESESSESEEPGTSEEPELTTDIDVEEARKWFYCLDSCYDENGEVIIHADLTRYSESDIPGAEFDINKYIEMYKAHGYSYDGDESDLLALNETVLKKYGSVYYKLVLTDPVLEKEVVDGILEGVVNSGKELPEGEKYDKYVESIKTKIRDYLSIGMRVSWDSRQNTYDIWMYGELRFDGHDVIRFTENAEWCPRWLEYNAEDRVWFVQLY